MITKADAQDKADSLTLFVTLKNARGVHAYASSTAGSHNYVFNNYVLRFMGLSEDKLFNTLVNVFAYTFIIMISLIAVANVFNTISTNIKLRRRELAMLRSVGMSDRDFQKMMNFECVFYGVKALLFGLPISVISSWLIYKGMVDGADNINFVFPWGSMAISVFSVFFVVFITMLYSISKIKKKILLMHFEMT